MQFRDLQKQYEVLKPEMDAAMIAVASGAHFISGEQVKTLEERLAYLRNLAERKESVKASIAEQEKLTDELAAAIDAAQTLAEVEDLYRPFNPMRRTRATVAKEKGLEPLAALLFAQERDCPRPEDAAAAYIDAVKGVETGLGFASASLSGKDVHDDIFYDGGFARRTNRAGGSEGGMSNGEEIVLRVAMKPIPTLMKGLKTVDVATREEAVAASERSDVCAIFALEIIAEAAVAEVLAEAVAERLGGDTMAEVAGRYARLT